MYYYYFFFFFKQKTAYEMRISDWSSDVCSSDLQGDPEAKASEMEHAIRKHCTVHFDEDPAFYKRMSEKLERLIQQHGKNWDLLADEYEQLRSEDRKSVV